MSGGLGRLAGVIGHPIAHSLSPAIHNAAFAACGLDWTYVAFDVPAGGGAGAVAAVRALGLVGLVGDHAAQGGRRRPPSTGCPTTAAALGAVEHGRARRRRRAAG